jgi:cleavage and polyadenylation specificity factor subunit 1
MTLLPRTQPTAVPPASSDSDSAASTNPDYEILITTMTGAMFLLSPLTEQQYRRLGTLANHLANTLNHPAGLNPKAYRAPGGGIGGVGGVPESVLGGRPVIDGSLLFRWTELGAGRRSEFAGRVGIGVETIRDDLEDLQGGLGYL